MKEAISCGGIVIYKGKILCLYKKYYDHYQGWVLPKGTVEKGETLEQTAIREIKEESGADAKIVEYIGNTSYTFKAGSQDIQKNVHWYLCKADAFYSKPQREEFFVDSGYYKLHEAIHLLKFDNERNVLETGYNLYRQLSQNGIWDEK